LPAPALQVFLQNLLNAALMFNWDDGEIWVHSVPHRPALDAVTASLFLLGLALLALRWLRSRTWRDGFVLLSIPILLLPSVLSLSFPEENPALNRAAAAAIPAILVAALALDGLITAFGVSRFRIWLASALTLLLLSIAAIQNYDLVFRQYDLNFRAGAWNSSEMGSVLVDFRRMHDRTDTFWIVPYPHWVDTRLPAIWAGIPNRDLAITPEALEGTLLLPAPKLFLFRPEDAQTEQQLNLLYPDGQLSRYASRTAGKDFMMFLVPE